MGMTILRVLVVRLTLIFLSFLLTKNAAGTRGVEIMVLNAGYKPIWVGVYTHTGHTIIPTGFQLESRDIYYVKVLGDSWSGTIWARTGCTGNPANSTFICETGDCHTHIIHCHRNLPQPPATLIKFDIGLNGSTYEVDLRYGFNLAFSLDPLTNQCKAIPCLRDMRSSCPDWLAVYNHDGSIKVGCKSACYTTADPKLCCSGAYASPEKCELNEYTQLIEENCPLAVSNVYDQTHFTCFGGVSYKVTFFDPNILP